MGQSKTGDVEEFTYSQWSSSATDLILLNLLQEYEKLNTIKKSTDGEVGGGKSQINSSPESVKLPALLDPLTLRVGLSFRGHKKVQNIFQLMFIKQLGNQMH